jgi:hypothetical protein
VRKVRRSSNHLRRGHLGLGPRMLDVESQHCEINDQLVEMRSFMLTIPISVAVELTLVPSILEK